MREGEMVDGIGSALHSTVEGRESRRTCCLAVLPPEPNLAARSTLTHHLSRPAGCFRTATS